MKTPTKTPIKTILIALPPAVVKKRAEIAKEQGRILKHLDLQIYLAGLQVIETTLNSKP